MFMEFIKVMEVIKTLSISLGNIKFHSGDSQIFYRGNRYRGTTFYIKSNMKL